MADTVMIATEDIYAAPGVLAFTRGQVVPEDVVKELKVEDFVASSRTKAAANAVENPAAPAK